MSWFTRYGRPRSRSRSKSRSVAKPQRSWGQYFRRTNNATRRLKPFTDCYKKRELIEEKIKEYETKIEKYREKLHELNCANIPHNDPPPLYNTKRNINIARYKPGANFSGAVNWDELTPL